MINEAVLKRKLEHYLKWWEREQLSDPSDYKMGAIEALRTFKRTLENEKKEKNIRRLRYVRA
jgi:hypothetical protein